MIIVGVDPGASGCIAVLVDGEYSGHMHMPTMKVGNNTRVNAAALAAYLRQFQPHHAYIEMVGPMPGQGTASMFSFGHSAGVAQGVIQGMCIPSTMVTPQSWKKRAGLMGQTKDASRARAIQLWPGLRELDLISKGQALADALLIAKFGDQA